MDDSWCLFSSCVVSPDGEGFDAGRQALDVDEPPDLDIVGARPQQVGVMAEVAQAPVASLAQQRSKHSGIVAVIDAKALSGPECAERAKAVLAGDHGLVVLQGDPVPEPKELAALRHGSPSIGCPPVPLTRVSPRPLGDGPRFACSLQLGSISRDSRYDAGLS
jgi:hypothetical protein